MDPESFPPNVERVAALTTAVTGHCERTQGVVALMLVGFLGSQVDEDTFNAALVMATSAETSNLAHQVVAIHEELHGGDGS